MKLTDFLSAKYEQALGSGLTALVIASLALDVAAAILRIVLDTKARSPRGTSQFTDFPIILEADRTNQPAEVFRTMRTNLLFVERDAGQTLVMFAGDRCPPYVLPANKVLSNPSELLGSSQVRALPDMFGKSFDSITGAAPPLLPMTVAAIPSLLTVAAIVFAAAGRTVAKQRDGILDLFEDGGGKSHASRHH